MALIRLVAAATVATILAACGESGAPPPAFKPSLDTARLMSLVLEPAAEGVWDRGGWIISQAGEESLFPVTEEDWHLVEAAAATVAESGNLLLMPAHARDAADWAEMSIGLVDAGTRARLAAEARDTDALFEAGGHIYNVCRACHNKYWPDQPLRP